MDQPGAPHGETAGQPGASGEETFNPWSVVNLVFEHLAAQGLHPVLGETGDPGRPAADLLRALGIEPAPEGEALPHEAGVVGIPTAVFCDDPEVGRPFVRFAFCKRDDVLDEAVGRLLGYAARRH